MARIVDNGDGTFQYYDDPVQDWRMARDVRAPDPPPFVPNVSPVYQSKNEAARAGYFTPEATADFYRTPTHITYGVQDPFGNPGIGGQYHPDTGQIVAWRHPETPGNLPNIMQHEYLHKRYNEDIDPFTMVNWALNYNQVQPEWLPSFLNESPIYQGIDGRGKRDEAYAYTGGNAPYELTPEQRQAYYPGVYDERAIAQAEAQRAQAMQSVPVMQSPNWIQGVATYNPDVRPFTQFQMAYDDAINNDSFRKHMMSKFQQNGPWFTSEAFDY